MVQGERRVSGALFDFRIDRGDSEDFRQPVGELK